MITPFNIFSVFVAGAVWIVMMGEWILLNVAIYHTLVG